MLHCLPVEPESLTPRLLESHIEFYWCSPLEPLKISLWHFTFFFRSLMLLFFWCKSYILVYHLDLKIFFSTCLGCSCGTKREREPQLFDIQIAAVGHLPGVDAMHACIHIMQPWMVTWLHVHLLNGKNPLKGLAIDTPYIFLVWNKPPGSSSIFGNFHLAPHLISLFTIQVRGSDKAMLNILFLEAESTLNLSKPLQLP